MNTLIFDLLVLSCVATTYVNGIEDWRARWNAKHGIVTSSSSSNNKSPGSSSAVVAKTVIHQKPKVALQPSNQNIGSRTATLERNSVLDAEGIDCFHCSSIQHLNGSKLSTEGWTASDDRTIDSSCWNAPKNTKKCQKGCASVIGIGRPKLSSIANQVRKDKSTSENIRMIYRTCEEDVNKMLKPDPLQRPFEVPKSNCSFIKGWIDILQPSSSLSWCTCKENNCNKDFGVIYSLNSGNCRFTSRRYTDVRDAPAQIQRLKPTRNDECQKFCAKNSICSNANFDPKEHPNAYCFKSTLVSACTFVVTANSTQPLPSTTIRPGVKPIWVFCEACST